MLAEGLSPTVDHHTLPLFQLAEEYGPVFTLHFGFQKVVVLTGYEVVREALVNYTEEFVDRPSIPIFDQIQNGNGTRAMTEEPEGEAWKLFHCLAIRTVYPAHAGAVCRCEAQRAQPALRIAPSSSEGSIAPVLGECRRLSGVQCWAEAALLLCLMGSAGLGQLTQRAGHMFAFRLRVSE